MVRAWHAMYSKASRLSEVCKAEQRGHYVRLPFVKRVILNAEDGTDSCELSFKNTVHSLYCPLSGTSSLSLG